MTLPVQIAKEAKFERIEVIAATDESLRHLIVAGSVARDFGLQLSTKERYLSELLVEVEKADFQEAALTVTQVVDDQSVGGLV